MSVPAGLAGLPTFLALDASLVLEGARRGASVQLDRTYFRGQRAALQTLDVPSATRRRTALERSRELYEGIEVDFASVTEEALWTASRRLRQLFRNAPEVRSLDAQFPGTCFVLPEWVRAGGEVKYGARVYLFRDGSAPEPDEILRANIEATVDGTPAAFERYQGRLHGYPECCIEQFVDRDRGRQASPELAAVDRIADRVDGDRLPATDPSVRIDDLLPTVFETADAYAFFAREFFPGPGCATARKTGIELYETLLEGFPETLVRDRFRLDIGWSFSVARASSDPGRSRPTPGALGREHLLFYLPLGTVLGLPRYRIDGEETR